MALIFYKKKLFVSPWGSDVKFVKPKTFKGFIIKKYCQRSNIITIDADYMSFHVLKFGPYKEKIEN